MSLRECAECQSIRREFAEAADAVRKLRPEQPGATDLAAWLDRLNEDEYAETRERSRLWAALRRQRVHRVLTGHYVPVSLWPGDTSPSHN
jgi:hypothetical protein